MLNHCHLWQMGANICKSRFYDRWVQIYLKVDFMKYINRSITLKRIQKLCYMKLIYQIYLQDYIHRIDYGLLAYFWFEICYCKEKEQLNLCVVISERQAQVCKGFHVKCNLFLCFWPILTSFRKSTEKNKQIKQNKKSIE